MSKQAIYQMIARLANIIEAITPESFPKDLQDEVITVRKWATRLLDELITKEDCPKCKAGERCDKHVQMVTQLSAAGKELVKKIQDVTYRIIPEHEMREIARIIQQTIDSFAIASPEVDKCAEEVLRHLKIGEHSDEIIFALEADPRLISPIASQCTSQIIAGHKTARELELEQTNLNNVLNKDMQIKELEERVQTLSFLVEDSQPPTQETKPLPPMCSKLEIDAWGLYHCSSDRDRDLEVFQKIKEDKNDGVVCEAEVVFFENCDNGICNISLTQDRSMERSATVPVAQVAELVKEIGIPTFKRNTAGMQLAAKWSKFLNLLGLPDAVEMEAKPQ